MIATLDRVPTPADLTDELAAMEAHFTRHGPPKPLYSVGSLAASGLFAGLLFGWPVVGTVAGAAAGAVSYRLDSGRYRAAKREWLGETFPGINAPVRETTLTIAGAAALWPAAGLGRPFLWLLDLGDGRLLSCGAPLHGAWADDAATVPASLILRSVPACPFMHLRLPPGATGAAPVARLVDPAPATRARKKYWRKVDWQVRLLDGDLLDPWAVIEHLADPDRQYDVEVLEL